MRKTISSKEDSNSNKILQLFFQSRVDPSWSFAEYKPSDTSKWTHGYHRYPAKFIPQLVEKLFDEYLDGRKNSVINDPFIGCGTTIVSAVSRGYYASGTDVNRIAYKITNSKATPIDPKYLKSKIETFIRKISFLKSTKTIILSEMLGDQETILPMIPERHIERINYWFQKSNKKKLGQILHIIMEERDEKIQTFFQVAFSHILKNCSIWLQGSTKPTRDMRKKIVEPSTVLIRHLRKMQRGNEAFYSVVPEKVKKNLGMYLNIRIGDAKNQCIEDETVDLVVTSSPYVTSYEYADLHQLSTLWFDLAENLKEYRKEFIGSAYKEYENKKLNSLIATGIVDEMKEKSKKVAHEIQTFFIDMQEVIAESYRILKDGGRACYVIGNTRLKGVNILNAETFSEIMESKGFLLDRIIKREIPSKILPQKRDSVTGRFSKSDKADYSAYPTEYIVIGKK